MFVEFFLWPDQCSTVGLSDQLAESARLLRLQRFKEGECKLLAYIHEFPESHQALALLTFIRLLFAQMQSCDLLLGKLTQLGPTNPALRFLQAQYWMQSADILRLAGQPVHFWENSDIFWPLLLARAALFIHLDKLVEAADLLTTIPQEWQGCLEVIRLRCRILERQSRFQEALELLMPAVQRFPQHLPAAVHLIDLAIKARSQQYAIPILRNALSIHGNVPEILSWVEHVELLRNRVAGARRSSLQRQAWDSVKQVSSVASTNLLNCYDRLGYGEWLPFYPIAVEGSDFTFPLTMQENNFMQAASQELPFPRKILANTLTQYRQHTGFLANSPFSVDCRLKTIESKKPLTIAWITADLAYHPVSRFLLGYYAAGTALRHRHLLIDTCDHLGESNRGLFEALDNLEVHNLGSDEWLAKLQRIRDLQVDVAIDLSGWTAGHFMRGFVERLAPVQVSYLGYFATTGLPNMDAWLGDQHLFPVPMQEWHTESIQRLKRCFIAWQPPAALAESSVDVADASFAGGIRFGSFNHNRKLSDSTLRLWGELLTSLPASSLVLKACNHDDAATQELLCRRMRYQGLDPERVIWLPRADSAVEHLRQYGLVDVALDCFPNGGCTTTCEAIWMGTPVITLTGRSYVSRMSTAVLHGAGMGEWCANSPQHYLQLARAQADRLSWLRQHRNYWRHQLQTHPLGDAADLMVHLENEFTALAASAQ